MIIKLTNYTRFYGISPNVIENWNNIIIKMAFYWRDVNYFNKLIKTIIIMS